MAGKVVEEDFLSLLVQLVGVISAGSGSSLLAQVIEGRALVVTIVGAVAISSSGGVQLPQVVLGGRVVRLPAGTEGALHLTVGDRVTEFLEGRDRVGGRVDAQVVLELVHDGVVKRLGTTIGVVGEGELAVVLGDGVSLGPQFLGLGGVELQVVGTLEGVGVARVFGEVNSVAAVALPLSTLSMSCLRLRAMEMAWRRSWPSSSFLKWSREDGW